MEPYDPNDAVAPATYWKSANIKRGRGRPVVAVIRPTLNMRVDADVLDAFKATGQGWQTRINAVLRDAVACDESLNQFCPGSSSKKGLQFR